MKYKALVIYHRDNVLCRAEFVDKEKAIEFANKLDVAGDLVIATDELYALECGRFSPLDKSLLKV